VDTEAFSPSRRDPGIWGRLGFQAGMTFLYVGRVSKEKNLELLADAFRLLGREYPETGLVIVGDGPYREALEERLAGTNCLFTGFRGGDELRALYASADVFVFPSTTDTFGNVVLEAQASGLPVIVSDQGGPHELMINGTTGVVISELTPRTLADGMARYAAEPNLAAEMGRAATRFTVEHEGAGGQEYETILRCAENPEALTA
jgi:glycosyltransferase involved in cell wall biosynthesis